MNRIAKIEQVKNGYIVITSSGLTGEKRIYVVFEKVIDALTFYFEEAEG